ncbi:uncharacterized protein (TIGR04141 family) [Sphingobium xanthum]|uniref:DUF6119 family protein n=1 Tax=Sphingobium xanthum TaxID=1387165 RepID=UPI001C8BA249|nr:DUF6119 family protein [Sphingobium xanthum]
MLKVATVTEALKADHELRRMASEVGELWVGQSDANPPGWVDFLGQLAPAVRTELQTQSCAAILFVETATPVKRLFAICFGQGHHALDESSIEQGFGLKVTLNQVSRDRLRTIDSATLDSTVMQKRTQSSRNADLGAFEINTDRDLIRLAAGNPASSTFAKALAGRDALSVRAPVAPRAIIPYCERALEIYHEKTYQRDFKFVDHVQPVGDRKLRDTLDALAFAELSALVAGKASDLHLAIPDILAPEEDLEIGYFGLGLSSGRKSAFTELAIEDYVAELQKGDFSSIASMAELRASHQVCVIKNGQADREHRRKLYSCFVFEAQHKKLTYVLFDGQWYLVDRAFYAEVEKAYLGLVTPAFAPSTTAKNERAFIAELLANSQLLCLDQARASPAGATGANFEPCDFLSAGRQLIHLKDGHSSSPLSHLWNQGLVSTESFVRDSAFRTAFRKAVTVREKQYRRSGFLALIPDGRTKPLPSDFTVVYGVMRHPNARTGSLSLPFFSKIALRAVAERLDMMGFKVELHLIAKT